MIIGIQNIHLLSDDSIPYFPNTNKGGVIMDAEHHQESG